MWHHQIPTRLGLGGALALMLTAACGQREEPRPPTPAVQAPAEEDRAAATAAAEVTDAIPREIPYEGAFGPADPPRPPLPPMQKPLDPWVMAALDVWWERPSPEGPEPIPLAQPKAIYARGQAPVIQVLPGPLVFKDETPKRLQTLLPEKVPASNNVKRLPSGEIRLVAFDNTLNDTKLSKDSMELEISFTDANGDEWRIEQVTLAPISSNPVAEPWYGGLVIDTLYHGHTGNGTPIMPLLRCMLCSWGWADAYKNGQRVASSMLLHIMLTSDLRGEDFNYMCYECAENPVREVHVMVFPMFYLPSPGGFLHIMWENAEWERGTPEQVAATAPKLGDDVPTIHLRAAPYLTWDQKEIHVKAGQKYRLVVTNDDPSSFHQFHLHSHPAGEGDRAQDARHEHAGTGGRIGGLWKPEQEHDHGHGGDPPAPRHVFLTLPQGATWATFVTFEKPGEYEFMCPVANHYRRGMEGKFVVSAADSGDGGQAAAPQDQGEPVPVRKGDIK